VLEHRPDGTIVVHPAGTRIQPIRGGTSVQRPTSTWSSQQIRGGTTVQHPPGAWPSQPVIGGTIMQHQSGGPSRPIMG
jgi:hypothetical protein